MTVQATVRKAGATPGNSLATVFPFAFKVFLATDLAVTLKAVATGIESTLVLNDPLGYTVALNPDQNAAPGGSITYNPAGVPMPATQALTISSVVPELQGTHIINGGAFFANNIEDAVDKAVINVQDLALKVGQSLQAPVSDPAPAKLPAVIVRAGRVLGFDQNGDPIAFSTSVVLYGVLLSKHTAAALQTVFNLAFAYTPGINAISVYVNGLMLESGVDYTETGVSQITMAYGLAAGDRLIAKSGAEQANPAVYDAALVQYTPGTDAITNVAAQLKKTDVVDTIALLKAKLAPGNKHTVIVLGFAAAGDGGGGLYWWNAADVTADNGGSVIQLNAGGNGRFNKLF